MISMFPPVSQEFTWRKWYCKAAVREKLLHKLRIHFVVRSPRSFCNLKADLFEQIEKLSILPAPALNLGILPVAFCILAFVSVFIPESRMCFSSISVSVSLGIVQDFARFCVYDDISWLIWGGHGTANHGFNLFIHILTSRLFPKLYHKSRMM